MRYRYLMILLAALALAACSSSTEEADVHYDWQARNAQWFAEKYDSAMTAITEAKAVYPDGNEWQQHCDGWRLYRTLQKSQDVQGASTDYIVCKVLESGTGKDEDRPNLTDSVRLVYRAWLMDVNYPQSKDNVSIFSQSYYGTYDARTTVGLEMPVLSTVEGFQNALQYMTPGDSWLIYIPQELAYGEESSDAVPAYSTLLYNIRLLGVIRR